MEASPSHPARIVVVDDAPDMLAFYAAFLEAPNREVLPFTSAVAALSAPELADADLVITDLVMPGMDGIEFLRKMQNVPEPPETIMVTGQGRIVDAVQAMRAGARDVLEKPVDGDRLKVAVERALEYHRLFREVNTLKTEIRSQEVFSEIVGQSSVIRQVTARARAAAQTSATVLITGDSGTGKEVFAQAIHKASKVADGPWVALNCAAIAPGLIESELFGHEKGSFTGAVSQHRGCFEQAAGGTLFLDEIGELGMDMQAKLLRVLQERRFKRVGGEKELTVTCRLIAATNANLEQRVEERLFRSDLFFRLKVVQLHLPPLNGRPDDILPLALFFVQRYAQEYERPTQTISPEVQAELLAHDWPGNVRELANVIESAMVFCDDPMLRLRHLPPELLGHDASNADDSDDLRIPQDTPPLVFPVGTSLDTIERIAIERTLAACNGIKERTARILGIGVRTIFRKLKEYQEKPPSGPMTKGDQS